jgi:hypothetical protein
VRAILGKEAISRRDLNQADDIVLPAVDFSIVTVPTQSAAAYGRTQLVANGANSAYGTI